MSKLKNNSLNEILLINNLSKFGLNPLHWKILFVSKCNYLIMNIEDPDFRFLGNINKDCKWKWSKIALHSI